MPTSDAGAKIPIKVPTNGNGVRIRYLLGGGDGYTGKSKLFMWDINGCPLDCYEATLTAGSMQVLTHPATLDTLDSEYYYADTIALANNNVSAEFVGTSGGNGVLEIRFDLKGGSYLFADYDVDAGSGTSATDIIALYKFY